MFRTRIVSSIAAATIGIALLGACSAESLAERAVGFGLEQAVEGDENIDLDFSGDGGFSIETEEGSFSLDLSEEGGGIVFDTDDGSGVINVSEDGIVFDTDDGSGAINLSEDGEVVFQSDDGTSAVFGGTDVPANWPAVVGVPQSATPENTFFNSFNTDTERSVSGVFQHSADDPFAEEVVNRLLADGWSADSSNQTGFANFTKGEMTATMLWNSEGYTSVSITNP